MTIPPAVVRWLHLAVAIAALIGFAMELYVTITAGPGPAPSHAERIVRLFSYFTIQSNLLIGIVSLLLAVRPERDSLVFRVARLDSVLCIALTGIVYNTVLRGIGALTAAGPVSNALLHVISPVLAVIVWLVVGPRGWGNARVVGWSVAYPLAWLAYTFVRGAATGWFPYPFLDAGDLGWGPALANAGLVAVVFLLLALAASALDRRLGVKEH